MAETQTSVESKESKSEGQLPIDKMASQMYPEKDEASKGADVKDLVEKESKEAVKEPETDKKDDAMEVEKASASANVDSKDDKSSDTESEDKQGQGLTLNLPDGAALDKAHVDEFAAFASEQKLTQDQAQKLLERENAIATRLKEAEAKRLEDEKPFGPKWKERDAEWRKRALSDKEIGGTPERLAENGEIAKRAINAFGDKEMLDFLDKSGLGSHPMTIKMFSKIGRLTEEGKIKIGGQPNGGKPKSPEERMYPNMYKQQNQ